MHVTLLPSTTISQPALHRFSTCKGENDAVAPRRFSQVLKNMLGDRVTVVVLRNAGHAMAPEQPKAMADAISDFAKRVNH